MSHFGITPLKHDLSYLGLQHVSSVFWNLSPAELVEETILTGQGNLADTGALAIDTGEFTGRSPKDKFIVCDAKTENTVWWGDINIKFDPDKFERLRQRI
ncbi:MAG TPA: phosphoenolpyruvate carboxykinase (ATP), partial [Flavobacteriales bacterium]|nr:phosphoenolpyruvate carboxykinase (ATP) [Flavobacteriales bacterium]